MNSGTARGESRGLNRVVGPISASEPRRPRSFASASRSGGRALAGILGCSLLAACFLSDCSGVIDRTALRGRGLALVPAGKGSAKLIWELNVGILNDRDLGPVSEHRVRRLLARLSRRYQRSSGVEFRFLIDQAHDARFLLERGRRRRAFGKALAAVPGPILSLDPDVELNRGKIAHYGLSSRPILAELASLQAQKSPRTGMPLLYQKPTASFHAWRYYVESQARYDLIFTNSLIFDDDLRNRGVPTPMRARSDGRYLFFVAPASSRKAMEGAAAVVSLYGACDGAGERAGLALRHLLGKPTAARKSFLRGVAAFHGGSRRRGC